MKRASLSRRSLEGHHGSFKIRSRSEERKVVGEFDNMPDKQHEESISSGKDDGLFGFDYENGRKKKTEHDHNHTDDEDNGEFYDALEPSGLDAHAAGPPDRIIRRAMSDPFDAQLMEEEALKEEDFLIPEGQDKLSESGTATTTGSVGSAKSTDPYPTLPRYPVAATRDKNCWSEPPIQIYSVRGPSYLKDKKKVPSSDYLLRTRGFDLFLFEGKVDIKERTTQILNGKLRALPTLAINFQFPWGAMILYFEIPANLAKYVGQANKANVKRDASLKLPSESVLANWLQGDTGYKNERFKLIPYVAEGPWVVRNMVTGRPAIIGKKLPIQYQAFPATLAGDQALLLCTLDIGSSSAAAKRIVSVCRRYMSALTVDIGFVIQGDAAQELPEQMLGAIRVHGPDPLKACRL